MDCFRDVEKAAFNSLLVGKSVREAATLFVLGAPRTGSTILYQALCSRFELPYIANLTNEYFSQTPIIGLSIQKSLPVDILFTSRYGKTEGAFQPSEGSAVMAHWFGGGHPSALVSNTILKGMTDHFLKTLLAAECLFGRPLIIKNAWNCFRIPFLAEALPDAQFIWIRRNIADAAKSDLAARYAIKGSPELWNSATPANVEELRRLPPAQQVVENQRAFNATIGEDLMSHAKGRWTQVWYDEFCQHSTKVLNDLAAALELPLHTSRSKVEVAATGVWRLSIAEETMIDAYIRDRNCKGSR